MLSLPAQTMSTKPTKHPASLTIPTETHADLTFVLTSGNVSKIGVPSSVVIAAGSAVTRFEVTNYNDANLDGIQTVAVTASNYLYPVVLGIITNYSAPVQLDLVLPAQVTQQTGSIIAQAAISSSVVVGSNFQAQLSSSDATLLSVPQTIHIATGQTNAVFALVSPITPEITGRHLVTVTASAGPGTMTSGSTEVLGLAPVLSLFLPPQLEEGSFSNGTVTDSGGFSNKFDHCLDHRQFKGVANCGQGGLDARLARLPPHFP